MPGSGMLDRVDEAERGVESRIAAIVVREAERAGFEHVDLEISTRGGIVVKLRSPNHPAWHVTLLVGPDGSVQYNEVGQDGERRTWRLPLAPPPLAAIRATVTTAALFLRVLPGNG